MAVYVISSCFVQNLESKKYLTQVLLPFTQENSLKIGIDKEKKVIDCYSKIAENNPGIASWLSITSMDPAPFEVISTIIDGIQEEFEMFLFLAGKLVNNKKLIISSYQSLEKYDVSDSNQIVYSGSTIQLFDRDEAIDEITKPIQTTTIIGSVVATGGSKIKNSNIDKDEKQH